MRYAFSFSPYRQGSFPFTIPHCIIRAADPVTNGAAKEVPIFEQLKKQILEFISIGILLPNDKLPSVRSLATDIGVNPNTVSKAYQELENQGYIYSVKGKGCFIADNQTDQLIKDDKLDDFKGCVNEMKKHQITKDKLLEIIEEVYKEETV